MSETIITKKCGRCKQVKPVTKFHKNRARKDGFNAYCKSCQEIYNRNYQKTTKAKASQRIRNKKYQKTPKGKINHQARIKRFNKRHTNQIKATTAVNHAIAAGKLARPDALKCHYCPKQAKEYHHYKGYDPEHWLDVVPVCVSCHGTYKTTNRPDLF